MKIVSWNIRGFNCPIKHSEVRDYLKDNNIDILALLETRVKVNKAFKIRTKFQNWSIMSNYNKHYNGRIWVFSNHSTVAIVNSRIEDQFIDLNVHHHGSNMDLHISMVYGSNDAHERQRLWSGLADVSFAEPWLVLGDFNVVIQPFEKLSNNPPALQDMIEFNNCLDACSLDDLTSSGCEMTWNNKQDPHSRVWSKLDRVLEAGLSDHSLVLVHVSHDSKKVKRCSFLNSWIDHPAYLAHHSSLLGICLRKSVAPYCQRKLISDPFSAALIHQERVLVASYSHLMETERSILYQRAKVKNMQHSDCSSKYFFAMVFERHNQQVIGAIKDQHGQLHTDPPSINQAFQDYYQHLLGTSSDVADLDWDFVFLDFCKAVAHFFHCNHMSKQATSTLISLIPKKTNHAAITDYKPISCCFFPGKSGVRQGHPLSPYLFVLGMKILSRYLRTLCTLPNVSRHPKCSRINLTYLIFADDLMVFTRGGVPSVQAVQQMLHHFAAFSGLSANVEKTNIYFGGVHPDIKTAILAVTSFSEGQFPFRYLGM
ncbi:uncharacterized protein LOC141595200 [Silene latifolia]|uniref:uncharacterized protein LOC141595200 n=1 Tax=Silene latifolia TaxID=37657 RepID=UPI003D77E4E0